MHTSVPKNFILRARDNPFAVQKLHALPFRPQGCDWPEIMQRLEERGNRAAVIGPEGSGKTTFLYYLAMRLEEKGFRVTMEAFHRQKPIRVGDIRRALFRDLSKRRFILIDGADLLGRIRWLEVKYRSRRAGGLVVAAHRQGMLPTLLECSTSPALLRELVRELIGRQRSDVHKLCDSLFDKHHGNLRDALRDLYDYFAEQSSLSLGDDRRIRTEMSDNE